MISDCCSIWLAPKLQGTLTNSPEVSTSYNLACDKNTDRHTVAGISLLVDIDI